MRKEKRKLKGKMKYGLIIGFFMLVCSGFLSQSVLAMDIPDIFINYQTYNSNNIVNYGSLIQNASDNNNYRNFLDTNLKANDFGNYDNMVNFSNNVDYASYIYQQQKYSFNDDSFKLTNGNYSGIFNFESGCYENNFETLIDNSGGYIDDISYENNHIDVLDIYDKNSGSYKESCRQNFENQNFGSIEFWYEVSDNTKESIISVMNDTNNLFYFNISNENIYVFYNNSYDLLQLFDSNIWYHLRIDFEITNNAYLGLNRYTFQINVNGIQYDSYEFINSNVPDSLVFNTSLSDYDYHIYVDSLAYTFDTKKYYGNYDGLYTFNNEIGLMNDDISFINDTYLENGNFSIINNKEGHYSIMELNVNGIDISTNYLIHYFNESNVENFTMEFYMYLDSENLLGRIMINFYDDNDILALSCYVDDFFLILDKWYKVKIYVNCFNDTYIVYYDDIIDTIDTFSNSVNSIEYLNLGFIDDGFGSVYFDSISFYYYDVHIYNSTYTFTNDNDNQIPMDFNDNSGNDCFAEVNPYISLHSKILQLYDGSNIYASEATQNFDNQVSGTIELYFYTTDYTQTFFINTFSSGTNAIDLLLDINGLRSYDGSIWQSVSVISSNTWYHLRIDFECGSGNYEGLTHDTFRIYLNEIDKGVYNFRYSTDNFNQLLFKSHTSACYLNSLFIDAIGYSWDVNYEIGMNLNEYVIIFDNYYELNDLLNQVDYNIIDNYDINDNLLSDYITDYDNDYYSFNTLISQYYTLDSSKTGGITYYEGYYYCPISISNILYIKKYDSNFKYVSQITSITKIGNVYLDISYDGNYFYIVSIDGILIIDNSGNLIADSFGVFHISSYYQFIVGVNGVVFLDYANDIYVFTDFSNGMNYDYILNDFNYLDLEYGVYSITYDYKFDIFYLMYSSIIKQCRYDYQDKEFILLNNFTLDFTNNYYSAYNYDKKSLLFSGRNSNYVFESIFSCYHLNQKSINTIYWYDSNNQLKGKIESGFDEIIYSINHSYIPFYVLIYYFDGSFKLQNRYSQYYDLNFIKGNFDLEIDSHYQIGYRDSFKELCINISIFYESMNYTMSLNLPYMSNYKFDKLLMYSFLYKQDSNGVYDYVNRFLSGINSNYYKNNLFGYRTIACLDLTQKFSYFYDFGNFDDIIDLSQLELPEIPSTPSDLDILPYWTYEVSTLSFDNDFYITTANFNFSYPLVVVDKHIEKYPYNPETIPYLQVPQIQGNWGIFDFLRAGLNFIIYVLVSIPNAFILMINALIVAIYFVGYLIALVWNTLIMTYLVGSILIFIVNIVGFGIVYGFTWFVDGIYIFITNIQRIILLGVSLISGLIALVIWSFTGFQADYNSILNAVNQILQYVVGFMLDTLTVILENIVIILFYGFAYVLCVELILLKYYYTKARGFKARSERIYESYLSYYLVIGYVIRFFIAIKNMITGWL